MTELRPPAGHYLSLSSGAEVPAELPSEPPLEVRWVPQEVSHAWAPGCPGAPEDDMVSCSLPGGR
eukprot:3220748-Alexandrium_andersonii.AAC.1